MSPTCGRGRPVVELLRERLGGGLAAGSFVRFRVYGTDQPLTSDASPAARVSGHARIPAAVAPGEVA